MSRSATPATRNEINATLETSKNDPFWRTYQRHRHIVIARTVANGCGRSGNGNPCYAFGKERERKGTEGAGRERKGKEGKGRERKGKKGKRKGKDGKGRERKGKEGEAGKFLLFEGFQAGCHVVLRGRGGTL